MILSLSLCFLLRYSWVLFLNWMMLLLTFIGTVPVLQFKTTLLDNIIIGVTFWGFLAFFRYSKNVDYFITGLVLSLWDNQEFIFASDGASFWLSLEPSMSSILLKTSSFLFYLMIPPFQQNQFYCWWVCLDNTPTRIILGSWFWLVSVSKLVSFCSMIRHWSLLSKLQRKDALDWKISWGAHFLDFLVLMNWKFSIWYMMHGTLGRWLSSLPGIP